MGLSYPHSLATLAREDPDKSTHIFAAPTDERSESLVAWMWKGGRACSLHPNCFAPTFSWVLLVVSCMFGSKLVRKAAKKGKDKYGWKGLVAAGVLAFVGKRVVKKKLKRKVA